MQASVSPTAAPPAVGDLVHGLLRAILLTPEDDRFRVIEENDLTVTQVRATVMLACSDPEPLAGGRIAERIGASPAAVSRALEGLVRKGFVTRHESEEDRRVRPFSITDPGRELAGDLVALRRAQIDRFLDTLDAAHRDRLRDALAPLAAEELLTDRRRRPGRKLTERFGHLITDENSKWWTLAAMCFALFMIMLDNTVMNVALPSIQKDLGASISSLEWVVNGYSLSFAVLLATGGRLGDILGRRRMFMTGVVLFALSSATAGLAPSTGALVASRVTQGVGAALMMPATLSIITNAFPPAERGRAIGTWAGVSALALALGPLLGGFLTEHVSWRAIFYLNIPVAAGAIVTALFAVRESRDETVGREIDWAGTAVLTAGLTAGVLALIEGNNWGWGSERIIALIVASIALLITFGWLESKVRAPIVQFEFLRNRNFFGALTVAFVISFAMLGMFFFMALYIQNILGYSPLEAGVRFLPTTLVIMVVAPIAGRMTDRIGARVPIVAGLALVAVSLHLQAQITDTSGYASLLVPFILMGFGIGLTMSPMSTAAMNAVHVTKSGLASGLLSMSRMVGGTFGVAVLGAIFQGSSRTELESALSGSGLPASQVDSISEQLGSGGLDQTLAGLPPDVARQAAGAAHDAFISGLTTSIGVSAAVAAGGAILAWFLIAAQRPDPSGEQVPDAPGEAPSPAPGLARGIVE